VRTVIEWSGQAVRSNIADILVGIKYRLMIGGTLITPQGSRSINTLLAAIDDSTEQMPRDLLFSGLRRLEPLGLGAGGSP
jgi:hypothetical protein